MPSDTFRQTHDFVSSTLVTACDLRPVTLVVTVTPPCQIFACPPRCPPRSMHSGWGCPLSGGAGAWFARALASSVARCWLSGSVATFGRCCLRFRVGPDNRCGLARRGQLQRAAGDSGRRAAPLKENARPARSASTPAGHSHHRGLAAVRLAVFSGGSGIRTARRARAGVATR